MGTLFQTHDAQKKKIIALAGRLVLENGGDTYRSEETILHLCRAFGAPQSDVVALPTGLFLTIGTGEQSESMTIRIKRRSIDLTNLDRINATSRSLCEGTLSLDEGERVLDEISRGRKPRRLRMALAAGISSAAFTIFFGGALFDALPSALCGFFCQLLCGLIPQNHFASFFRSGLGGVITSGLAAIFVLLFGGNFNPIVIGALMPLVPGLSLTNAVRDLIRGDLVSGGAILTESMLMATSLAVGVSLGLSFFLALGGVV